MARHVRTGDQVMVISGKDRGRTGRVIRVLPKKDKVVVQGINVKRKHLRPSQANPRGGVIDKELPLHISNVQPLVDGKPTRVRFETKKDGTKVRVAVTNGATIGDPVRKGR